MQHVVSKYLRLILTSEAIADEEAEALAREGENEEDFGLHLRIKREVRLKRGGGSSR